MIKSNFFDTIFQGYKHKSVRQFGSRSDQTFCKRCRQTLLAEKELTIKGPNTMIAEFANTVNPDETAQQFILKVFRNFFSLLFWAPYELIKHNH